MPFRIDTPRAAPPLPLLFELGFVRAFNTMQERLHGYLDSHTRVLSAMSHDLRTPQTRLKLRTESLDDEKLREKFNADLDEMQRMVTGALNLFRGIHHDEPLQAVRVDALVA